MKLKEIFTVYAIGSVGYMFIEILWRGRTHWTMGILGGICFLFIYFFENKAKNLGLPIKALVSALFVTFLEFLTGIMVNMIFKLNVWDYSNLKFNILGQISLVYSFLWYFICIPAHIMSKILKHRVFDVLPEGGLRKTKIFERQPSIR